MVFDCWVRSVSMAGTSDITSRTELPLATCSFRSREMALPTVRPSPFWTDGLNPTFSARISYAPGGSRSSRKAPSGPVVTLRVNCVSGFTAVMTTSATTASVASTTIPLRVAVLLDCPHSRGAATHASNVAWRNNFEVITNKSLALSGPVCQRKFGPKRTPLQIQHLPKSPTLQAAHRNFTTLLVLHLELVGGFEPGHHFADPVDVDNK